MYGGDQVGRGVVAIDLGVRQIIGLVAFVPEITFGGGGRMLEGVIILKIGGDFACPDIRIDSIGPAGSACNLCQPARPALYPQRAMRYRYIFS